MTDIELFDATIELLQRYERLERSATGKYEPKSVKTNGEEILVKDGETANFLVDLFELFEKSLEGADDVCGGFCTCYYDPEEDERDDCVDSNTGWWAIYPDGA